MRQETFWQRASATGSGTHREKNCWVPGEVLWLICPFHLAEVVKYSKKKFGK